MKFGLVINPIAGMGGRVGLKGTDGDVVNKARERGALPLANGRARKALENAEGISSVEFITASGKMGADILASMGLTYRIVHQAADETGKEDTMDTVKACCLEKADLLIFCGGDGTAADVMNGMSDNIPCIGIPSGVKMHSGVFANDPVDAGRMIGSFIKGEVPLKKGEVMDIDEDVFREGVLKARLIGYLWTLDEPSLLQPVKGTVESMTDEDEKKELAEHVVTLLEKDVLYIIGPGTTCKAITDELGDEKTLLGVDLYFNWVRVAADATEEDILRHLEATSRAAIIVTPIGHQGFIFGRGNQQISSKVIREVGAENIIVIATPSKARGIGVLKADTGDASLDDDLRGYHRVITGFGRSRMMLLE